MVSPEPPTRSKVGSADEAVPVADAHPGLSNRLSARASRSANFFIDNALYLPA